MKTEYAIGQQVTVNGRNYTVDANLGIGENTAKACPWIAAQYGISGSRGAVAMMIIFNNGCGRLIFTNRSTRVENFILN